MATRSKKVPVTTVPIENQDIDGSAKAVNAYLRRLKTRLTALSAALRHSALHEAELELKKCEALGKNIGDLVNYQKLDPALFFAHFAAINELSIDITHRIERMQNVWWRRLWRFVQNNIGQLVKPLLSLIGAPSGIKLLK